MQIFKTHQPYQAKQALLASVLSLAICVCQPTSGQALELEEKLPAIAPPTLNLPQPENRTKTSPLSDSKNEDVEVAPLEPIKPAELLTPTEVYNKGALAHHQKDYESALRHWIKASEMGVLGATWRIAHMYRLGLGTAVDHSKAYTYFNQVAEKHKFNAQRNRYTPLTIDALVWVGTYYRNGLPALKIKPDTEKALKIFRYTASHGQHPVAQYHLGDMYVTGNGVKANGPRGMRWLNLAAKKNYAPSQAALGELFWQGKAVGANKARAMMYFFLAIQSGRPSEKDRFRERLTMLKATSTVPEIERAQMLVNEWVTRQGKKSTN